MTEDEAKSWIVAHFGQSGLASMQRIVDAVTAESQQQNLIARSTLATIWSRHIVDSAQLLLLVDVAPSDIWVDIGSGAGFPGLVIAALSNMKAVLVEPRRRRADFLEDMVKDLATSARTSVICSSMASVSTRATVVSARAVGSLENIFAWSAHCADRQTRWVLPKGRSARDEVASVGKTWHGVFHVEQSITDPESLIVLATGVARR